MAHLLRRPTQLDRKAERIDRAFDGVLDLHHHLPRLRLLARQRLGVGVDRRCGNPHRQQGLDPIVGAARRQRGLDFLDQRDAVLQPVDVGQEPRIVQQVFAANYATQAAPQLLVSGADDEWAISGAHGLVRGAHPVRAADRRRHLARPPVFGDFPDRQAERAFKQRRIDVLTGAAVFPADYGAQDRVRGKQAGAEVGDGHAGFHRRAAGVSGHAHDARHRLRDQVESRPRRPRTGLAEARDAGVHQARIDFAQCRVIDLQARCDARPVVLHQDVGAANELVEDLAARGALQVDFDAALVAVERQEAAAVRALEAKTHRTARLVALAGRLDLDDVGAHVAEQHAAERPRHHLADVEDLEMRKRKRHAIVPYLADAVRATCRCKRAGPWARSLGSVPGRSNGHFFDPRARKTSRASRTSFSTGQPERRSIGAARAGP